MKQDKYLHESIPWRTCGPKNKTKSLYCDVLDKVCPCPEEHVVRKTKRKSLYCEAGWGDCVRVSPEGHVVLRTVKISVLWSFTWYFCESTPWRTCCLLNTRKSVYSHYVSYRACNTFRLGWCRTAIGLPHILSLFAPDRSWMPFYIRDLKIIQKNKRVF